MNLFYTSVTVTHPSGCNRTSLINRLFFPEINITFSLSTEYWFERSCSDRCCYFNKAKIPTASKSFVEYACYFGFYSAWHLFLLLRQVQLQINTPSHHKRLLRIPQLVWWKGMVPLGEDCRWHSKFFLSLIALWFMFASLRIMYFSGSDWKRDCCKNKQNSKMTPSPFSVVTAQRKIHPCGQHK